MLNDRPARIYYCQKLQIAAPKVNQAAGANSADWKVVVNGDEQVLGAKTP